MAPLKVGPTFDASPGLNEWMLQLKQARFVLLLLAYVCVEWESGLSFPHRLAACSKAKLLQSAFPSEMAPGPHSVHSGPIVEGKKTSDYYVTPILPPYSP